MVFRVLSIIGVIALFVSGLAAFPTPAQNPRIELAVDTNDFNQDGLLAIFGGLRLQGEIGLPVGAGDINGDGRADIIFCGMYGSAGPGTRRNNGQVNFYLSDGRDSGFIDAADPASNILTLFGADSGDLIGTSVATGDINGDGIRDVALGAFGDDGPNNSRFNAGATYIVLGSPNFNLKADLSAINVNGVPPPGIIVAYGSQANGRNGVWVDIADLDGDGFGDVIMGADQINSGDRQHTGGACVLFGGPALPQVIDLQNLPPGVRMTRIVGNGREEHMGAALHASDLNGDGFADIAIGASIFRDSGSYVTPDDQVSGHNDFGGSFDGRRARCGEVYVLWGSQNWPAVIDLSNRPANSARVIGANSG
ncbi:MAG TPA: hypothetical protein VNO70_20325, partial [Blastocatellia bacterium]|nr:hypothetical protein [Blastocatellia bacterium]